MLSVVMLSVVAPAASEYTKMTKGGLKIPSCGLYYKSFTIISYDRNDSGLYLKTIILAKLDLAMSVNYDHEVRCKLKCTL